MHPMCFIGHGVKRVESFCCLQHTGNMAQNLDMKSTMVLQLMILFIAFLLESEGAYFYIGKGFSEKGVCKYAGYKPGGGEPNIKPITAPEAIMPANAVAQIVGTAYNNVALASATTSLMESFRKGGKLFLNIAPKLGPALGVFGAALGFVASATNPSPQDILNQANKAIAKLTSEVNKRLILMEGYVDSKVIQLERDLINREYRTMFNYFGGCIKDTTKGKVDQCMMEAEKLTNAASPKFMILDNKINSYKPTIQSRSYFDKYPSKAPSYYDIKKIEAGIISFRDFANLHLLIISTLVNTFKEMSSEKANYARYVREQALAAKKYADYGKWAYNWILIRNVQENQDGKFKHSCRNADRIMEGWFIKLNTAYGSSCKLECTGMNKPAECKYRIIVRADGKRPSSYFRAYVSRCRRCFGSAAKSYGLSKANNYCGPFLTSLGKDIKTYYDGELLSNVKIWNDIAAKASKDAKSLPKDVAEMDYTTSDEASEDTEGRLERAEKLAMQQYRDMIMQQEKDSRIGAKKDMAAREADSYEEVEDDERDEDENYDDDVPEFDEK